MATEDGVGGTEVASKRGEDDQQSRTDNLRDGVNTRGLFGYSKLHEAASNGDANSLKSLLSTNPESSDVNGKTIDGGYTPLHLAASAGHAACVTELLNYDKTDMHVPDAFNRTPLQAAKQNFKSDVVKLLICHGKNLCNIKILLLLS